MNDCQSYMNPFNIRFVFLLPKCAKSKTIIKWFCLNRFYVLLFSFVGKSPTTGAYQYVIYIAAFSKIHFKIPFKNWKHSSYSKSPFACCNSFPLKGVDNEMIRISCCFKIAATGVHSFTQEHTRTRVFAFQFSIFCMVQQQMWNKNVIQTTK